MLAKQREGAGGGGGGKREGEGEKRRGVRGGEGRRERGEGGRKGRREEGGWMREKGGGVGRACRSEWAFACVCTTPECMSMRGSLRA
jgi:hypothetical protein